MDYALFRLINGLAGRSPLLDELMRFLATDYMVPTIAMTLVVLLWFSGHVERQRQIFLALLSVVVTNVVVKAMNLVYFRPRPFTDHDVTLLFYHPSDSSFPSNSAASLWSLAWAVWTFDRRLGTLFIALAVLMGFSRVYVGVHYPLDIVGGALVGIFSAHWVVRHAAPRLNPLIDRTRRVLRHLALT